VGFSLQELPGAEIGEHSVVPYVRDPTAEVAVGGAVAAGSRHPVAGVHGCARIVDGRAAEAPVLHRSSPSE